MTSQTFTANRSNPGRSSRAAWTATALTVIAADAASIATGGGDGPVGFLLFGAGIVAALYLLSQVLRQPVAGIARFVRRPRGAPRLLAPVWLMPVLAAALIPAAVGANVFKNHSGGIEDALNTVSFFSFGSIVTYVALLLLASGATWVFQVDRGR